MTNGASKILVVDDEKQNLKLIQTILAPLNYSVLLASDGEEALAMVREEMPDLILLDIMMPKMDGFEVARRLKQDDATKIIPVVMVTSLGELDDKVRALEAGADEFLVKPVESVELRARVKSLLKVKAYNDTIRDYQRSLESEVYEKTSELRNAYEKVRAVTFETINRLAKAAEYLDDSTSSHLQRISRYAEAIAREIELDAETIDSILYASPMHDVGKIGIPDRILMKPGKLTPAEWEIMKTHSEIGAKILSGSDQTLIRIAEQIALTHHEKWDGTGYPKGLKGEEIPIVGRITALADVFDALTSKRPYKEAFSLQKSISIIKESRGSHFEPRLVDAFLGVEQEIVKIMEQFRENKL